MLVRASSWSLVERKFTDQEKVIVKSAVMGETMCPRGWTIDEKTLGKELAEKLRCALKLPNCNP